MKKALIVLLVLLQSTFCIGQISHTIIPKPQEIKFDKTSFEINSNTIISHDAAAAFAFPTLDLLQKRILTVTLQKLLIKPSKAKSNFIHFALVENLKKEAYELNVKPAGVDIKASSPEGFFYGYQTLLQMLPSSIYSSSYQAGLKLKLNGVSIKDQPRFGYRGLLLDVGRYYLPIGYIKKTIDQLSIHKMNTLHWHLTEDQGWRIEIKKYPKLTEIGSIRKESSLGHLSENQGDGKPHGGFYTQDEIRDLVAYAQTKHVTIVPEIEMPGHSLAALAAYPELGCTGGPYEVKSKWGVEEQIYCPTEKTFEFLENVLTEVMDLFPSQYIHIGGDEAPKTTWKNSTFCQDLIKNGNLKDENGLQSYFIKRIDKFVSSKGRKIIGWDEILEGGLSPNATVMSWRGMEGGIEAAKQKHDVIMATSTHLYYDYYQSKSPLEPLAIGGLITLEKAYSLEPVPAELNIEEKKYIKGVQALLWTEYVSNAEIAEYMLYPRLAAAAEIAWSDEKKDYPNFKARINTQLERYQFMAVNYSKAIYDLDYELVKTKTGDYAIKINSDAPNSQIKYTTDGSEPNENSFVYSQAKAPLLINNPNLQAKLFSKTGSVLGRVSSQPFTFSKTLGKNYIFELQPLQYKGTTAFALTDGKKGSKNNFTEWVGFKDADLNVKIDLEQATQISRVDVGFLSDEESWVYLPNSLEILVSKDGTNYSSIKKIDLGESAQKGKMVQQINAGFEIQTARYIKIIAKNTGKANSTKKDRYLMADEISVY
jgi:hexosaminidase